MSQLLSNPMQKHVTKAEGKTESKYWALSFMTKVTKAVHLYHNRHHHNKAVRQLLPLVKWAQWLRLLERKGTEQDLWTSRRKKKIKKNHSLVTQWTLVCAGHRVHSSQRCQTCSHGAVAEIPESAATMRVYVTTTLRLSQQRTHYHTKGE